MQSIYLVSTEFSLKKMSWSQTSPTLFLWKGYIYTYKIMVATLLLLLSIALISVTLNI